MFKKILSLLIITTLALGVFSMSFAEEAVQLTSEDKINSLLKQKIITGYGDGTIRLEKSITRAEFSSVLAKIIIEEKDEEKTIERFKSKNHFSDLGKESNTNAYINFLFDKGIVSGYSDNTFKPKNEVTYNEVITMVVRALDLEVAKGSTWSEGYVNKAKELKLLEDIAIENFSQAADRQKVFELIYNTLELKK